MLITDLRNVLGYVRRFREKIFVIAIDGPVITDPNFSNVLLDIAALHSLNIHLVIVHGASAQIRRLAGAMGRKVTDLYGTGPTDDTTLEIARIAAGEATNQILDGLFACNQIRAAVPNAIKAKPAGVIQGVDHLYHGRVDRVDTLFLETLVQRHIVPVIPPTGRDNSGQLYRLNSDEVAYRVAVAMNAVKLVFVTDRPGVTVGETFLHHVTTVEMEQLLARRKGEIDPGLHDKIRSCLSACEGGVLRAHIVDGRKDECLLAEIFSNQGVGTMIHLNEYQNIREASHADVNIIWTLTQAAMEKEEVLPRTRAHIREHIDEYFVFEIDGAVLGCVGVKLFNQDKKAEVVSLLVSKGHENQGIGSRLVQYIEEKARNMGAESIFCLSTQAFSFFAQKLGFVEAGPDYLPEERRAVYERSGRRSKILVKALHGDTGPQRC